MYWTPPVLWAVIGLTLIGLEALVPGLVIMFFGMGALATALAVLAFDMELSHQLLLFALSSVAFLLGLRGWFSKLFQGRSRAGEELETMDALVGQSGVVSEAAPPGGAGRVKLRGTYFTAVSDAPLAVGDLVRVVDDPHGDHSVLKVEKQ